MDGCARHLELMTEVNKQYNLTRILSPREAAIKHVVDSIAPWRLFVGARHVVDAGSGAGFPGIPLALVLPDVQFSLLESTQKKAHFLDGSVGSLGLRNVKVYPDRVETWLKKQSPDIVTARAIAPLHSALPLFAAALRKGTRVLFYKGRDAQVQIEEALEVPANRKFKFRLIFDYELPEELGSRHIVEVSLGTSVAKKGSVGARQ